MKQVLARIRLLSVYIVLLLPVIVYGAVHALQSSNNSPIDWVDSSFSERRHYDEFVELFGPGDTVIASWPGCVRTDQRLDKLVRILRESKTFRTADDEPLIQQVVSGRETLLEMIDPPPAPRPRPRGARRRALAGTRARTRPHRPRDHTGTDTPRPRSSAAAARRAPAQRSTCRCRDPRARARHPGSDRSRRAAARA